MIASDPMANAERYELLGELATGGMATVYLGRMRRMMGFSRLVAIKCMHPHFAKDPSFVGMFMDEARLTARLRHPNIVPTLDIVADEGQLLLVMEYVEGTSLSTLIRSARAAGVKIPIPIACAIVHDLLLGLHEAHQAKDDDGVPLSIIHRDVSPQNVLVGLDGLSRVLDFGVAKARQNTHRSNESEIKGKIPYMPPEQLFGEALDHRVDVYAAGVTLWEALCCERLFDGPSETALVRQITEQPIRHPKASLPELPDALDQLVMKALERNPDARFSSALEMAEAIAACVPLPTRTEVSSWIRPFTTPREVPSERGGVTMTVSITSTTSTTSIVPIPAARSTRLAIGLAAMAFCVAGLAAGKIALAKNDPPPSAREAHVVATQATELATEPVALVAKASIAKTPPPRLGVATPAKPSDPCRIPYTIDKDGQKHYKLECM